MHRCSIRTRSDTESGAADATALNAWTGSLDHVCDKLARVGVRGLRGDLGLSAMDRRRTLVDHVVRSGLLGALAVPDDGPGVPQQSSAGRAG